MEDKAFKEFFSEIEFEAPAPPAGLTGKILLRIEREERRRLAIKTAVFGTVLVGSLSLIVYGWMNVAADASRSGFLVFASLLFSDFSSVLTSFSDFVLSVVESFPVFSATLLLSGVFVAIWSAAHFVNEVVRMRGHTFSVLSYSNAD